LPDDLPPIPDGQPGTVIPDMTPEPVPTGPPARRTVPQAEPELPTGPMLSEDYGAGGQTYVCGFCGDPTCVAETHWFGTFEFTALMRNRSRTVTVSNTLSFTPTEDSSGNQIDNVATLTPALSSDNAYFDFEPGMRTTMGRYLGRDVDGRGHTLEFTFFGFNSWDEQNSVQGVTQSLPPTPPTSFETPNNVPVTAGNLVSFFNGGSIGNESFSDFARGFDNAMLHSIEASSELYNFEFNRRIRRGTGRDQLVYYPGRGWAARQQTSFRPSALIGARVIKFRDDFDFFSSGVLTTPFETTDFSGAYMVQTDNILAGGQIGGDLSYITPTWNVGVQGKAGLYANFAQQNTQVVVRDASIFKAGLDPQSDAFLSASDQVTSFVGELSFNGGYRLTPYLSMIGSWNMMWMTGMVLAPEQFQINVPTIPQIRHDGFVYLQGMTVGFEYVY